MEYTWLILRRELRTIFSSKSKEGQKSLARLIASLGSGIALMVAVTYGAFRLFQSINNLLVSFPGLAALVSLNLLNGVAMYMLFIFVISGFQISYKTFYESGDIAFLLTQPVPTRSVFGAKFAGSYVSMTSVALLFGLTVWVGFGIANSAGPLFYIASATAFLLLTLFSHAVISLALLAVMRFTPGRKKKQTVMVILGILAVFAVFISQMASSAITGSGNTEQILQAIGNSDLNSAWYLPTTWTVNAILGTLPGFDVNAGLNMAALAVASLGITWVSLKAADLWFISAWSSQGDEDPGEARKRRTAKTEKRDKARAARLAQARAKGTSPRRKAGFRSIYQAILLKDLSMLKREPLGWYQIIISMVGLGFWYYNVSKNVQPGTNEPIGFSLVVMISILAATTSAQTGGISLSKEGGAFWLLRSSPVNPRELFWAKATYAWAPSCIFATVAMVAATTLGFPGLNLWKHLFTVLAIITTMSFIQIMLDILYPDFVMKVEFGTSSKGQGTVKLLTTMFLSMGIGIALGLLAELPHFAATKGWFPSISLPFLQILCYGALALIALGSVLIVQAKGTKRLEQLLTDM